MEDTAKQALTIAGLAGGFLVGAAWYGKKMARGFNGLGEENDDSYGVDWDYDPEAVSFQPIRMTKEEWEAAMATAHEAAAESTREALKQRAASGSHGSSRTKIKKGWRFAPTARKRRRRRQPIITRAQMTEATKEYCEKKKNDFYKELAKGNGELAYRRWKLASDRKCAWTKRTQAQAMTARGALRGIRRRRRR